jgi:hypothetical protein
MRSSNRVNPEINFYLKGKAYIISALFCKPPGAENKLDVLRLHVMQQLLAF